MIARAWTFMGATPFVDEEGESTDKDPEAVAVGN